MSPDGALRTEGFRLRMGEGGIVHWEEALP